jgi:hypothetical protein
MGDYNVATAVEVAMRRTRQVGVGLKESAVLFEGGESRRGCRLRWGWGWVKKEGPRLPKECGFVLEEEEEEEEEYDEEDDEE